MIGLGLGLGVLGGVVAEQYPAAGLVALFDVSDLSTLFQDSAGTTPVTAAGQSVGLWLDKAQGLTLGPERLTNSDFSAGSTGWIVSNTDATHIVTFADGSMRYQSGTSTPALAVAQANALIIGRPYRVTVTCSARVSGAIKTDSLGAAQVVASGVGTVTLIGIASSTTFSLLRNTTNVDVTIDNVSVRELPGYHARQANGGLLPTYQTGPARLIDDNFDDALPVALTGTYSVYSAVSGALVYTEGVVASGALDILQNNLSRCAIYDHALTAGERAQLAAYWGVTP